MRPARQVAGGLIYALISVVLVIGSLSLAVLEQNRLNKPISTPTPPSLATVPEHGATVTASPSPETTRTPMPTATDTSSAAAPTRTSAPPATPRPYLLSSNTPKPACGPLPGWVKSYEVKPGDTLFHISYLYGTTVSRLQQANCKTNAVIYPGELLWVPPGATITPGVTVIPTFASPTDSAGFISPTDDSLTATAAADP